MDPFPEQRPAPPDFPSHQKINRNILHEQNPGGFLDGMVVVGQVGEK
jgi:hypothetical protein